MTYSTIYGLDGHIIADGVQSQAVCNETINMARRIARDLRKSVVVEDRGTGEVYRITPSGQRWRAPPNWGPPSWIQDDE